ncbi:MAG TPA: flavodoxin domain-containing protein [Clostridia bacterium]|nr:flavodoxin domain-containing protein [Clostridia bacterium]
MKIGIIVHSKTGNTLSVAQELKEKLLKDGHSVNLEKLTAVNDDQTEAGKIQLKSIPDITEYDALIFGAPVRGFSLSPVMTAYLIQLSSLSNKKAACFLTQFFPFPSMGGNHAMEQMKGLCNYKDIRVCETGIVNWSNIHRRKKISDVIESFSKVIIGNDFIKL